MSFLYLFLVGILIGTAMIIPGVSGGVIAVIFNVYEKMIYSLTNLFKNFKKNFIFLFVLGLGIITGAVWFSKIMMFLYLKHEVITKLSFVGFILGGVPFLFKEIKKNTGKGANWKILIITFFVSLLMWYISENIYSVDLDSASNSLFINILKLFLAGIIYSIGKVIPGISGSFLLIIIGMYEYVLYIISSPFSICLGDVLKLIPFVMGLISGIIFLLKLINKLLKNNFRLVYSIIIGFVIGSIPALIPKIFLGSELFYGIIFMFFSFFISFKLSK